MTKKKIIDKQLTQSSVISVSRYTTNKDEKRILDLAMLSDARDKIIESRWFDFKLADYAKAFNVSLHEASRDTRQAIQSLEDRWIYLKQEDGTFCKVRWIDSVRTNRKYGTKGVRFTAEMLSVMQNTPKHFSYKLREVIGINNPQIARIFDWVFQELDENGYSEVTIDLDEMKERMMLTDHSSYKQYGNFKRVILNRAKEQINSQTSMTLDFRENKVGRRVESITFIGEMDVSALRMLEQK